MADLGAIGKTNYSVNRNTLLRQEPAYCYGKVKSGLGRSFSTIIKIDQLRMGMIHNNYFSRVLPSTDLAVVTIKERCPMELTSRHIQVWSVRPMTNWSTVPAQLYLDHTPGTISGVVKTSVVLDANHIVRLYYRPTGYLIDQVRTNPDGTFTFNRDIDKTEIRNYYVMAFDLTGNFNAVVFDMLTPG